MDDPNFIINSKIGKAKIKLEIKEEIDGSPSPKKKKPAATRTRNKTCLTKKKLQDTTQTSTNSSAAIKVEVKRETEIITKKRPNTDDVLKNDFEDDVEPDGFDVSVLETSRQWNVEELVAEQATVGLAVARNVMNLLDNDCTVPFIARYRRELTDGLDAEKLWDIHSTYKNVRDILKRAETVAKTLIRENKMDSNLQASLSNAKTLAEIEHLYAPFKSGSKRSLAEKARSLGLGNGAHALLNGTVTLTSLQPASLVLTDTKGLGTEKEILLGWQHVAADLMAHDADVLDFVRNLCQEDCDVALKAKLRAGTNPEEANKFQTYFDFRRPVALIKPHQVLALNRGESQKALTVKVDIPDTVHKKALDFCVRKWPAAGNDHETSMFLSKTAEDAFSRLLEPLMCRQIRSQLTKMAEKESVKVFSDNLKRLLLTPPVRGRVVLGIDPGFTHGCKLAVLSSKGEVLLTEVLHLHGSGKNQTFCAKRLHNILKEFSCETIALGNGTACRETETFLSDLIRSGHFNPISPQYCIVNESGVSIYSVTKEAEEELPGMDPNLRSAVSLARRLQDPLLEYVKVEPKHIGIGMYQHDVAQSTLKNALDEVAVECVSFVGVDLNVASEVILRRVAGLSASRARQIVAWRRENGTFCNRRQLLLVKGLGPKSFEQCAGFVKIFPETRSSASSFKSTVEVAVPVAKGPKKKKVLVEDTPNLLDATTVHPESYELAQRFLKVVGVLMEDVGKPCTIQKVKSFVNSHSLELLAAELETTSHTLHQIVESLSQPLEYDLRAEFERPLFRQGVISMNDLVVGQQLTGRVVNCTNFGAFVDVGVGCNGLLHSSCMGGQSVSLGDRVTVYVQTLDLERSRLGLRFNADAKSKNMPFGETSAKNARVHDLKWEAAVSTEELKIDQKLTGRVTRCTHFGVFVDVGAAFDGLLHSSHLMGRHLRSGEQVDVCVDKVNAERRQLRLRLADGSAAPKTEVPCVGAIFQGRVCSIQDYGAFVRLECGVSGLAHRSRMNGIQVTMGSLVSCRVVRVFADKGPQLELIP